MGERPEDARSVANFIVGYRSSYDLKTTNLELQKLVFFAHGSYLVKHRRPLIEGYFEAWDHGPVHPHLYQELKSFGRNPITNLISSTDLVTGERSVVAPPEDHEKRMHIAEVVLQLRGLSASQLRAKSHAKGGAWHSIVESAKIKLVSNPRIPDNVIRERYNRHILPVDRVLSEEGELDNALKDFPFKGHRSS